MNEINLPQHMSDAIRRIMAKAYANALRNPLEAKTVWRLQQTFLRSEKRRAEIRTRDGVDVPPFLICSIATVCNLHCKGCYARANGIAADSAAEQKPSLSPDQWKAIFEEAASLGINFALLAGGEPMMRRDILERVAEVEDMVFPIFTNGTLIGPSYISFLKQHLNMIPVISIEGLEHATDERRGKGMYRRAMLSVEMLHKEDLLFGTSITVTTENFDLVTSDAFVERLRAQGCKLIIYVEYVPTEPCPFSPFSDTSVLETGVRGALASPLFRRLRDARLVGGEHTGGCALYEHRDEVRALVSPK